MSSEGFYKINANGGLMYAPNFVYNKNFQLNKDDPDKEAMAEVDGWKWFDTDSNAYTYFQITPESNPWEVTPLQAKLALHGAGLLESIEAYVKTADKSVQIAWEYASSFNRTSPLLLTLASGLGLTETQLDDLFTAARQIKV